jgi:preprotein translocase subunit Sec61beta
MFLLGISAVIFAGVLRFWDRGDGQQDDVHVVPWLDNE